MICGQSRPRGIPSSSILILLISLAHIPLRSPSPPNARPTSTQSSIASPSSSMPLSQTASAASGPPAPLQCPTPLIPPPLLRLNLTLGLLSLSLRTVTSYQSQGVGVKTESLISGPRSLFVSPASALKMKGSFARSSVGRAWSMMGSAFSRPPSRTPQLPILMAGAFVVTWLLPL